MFCRILYFVDVKLKAMGPQTDPNVPAVYVYFCCLRKQH